MSTARLAHRRPVSSRLAAALFAFATTACLSGGAGTSESSSGADARERVRIVAANLTSGNDQSYDLGHGARILDGIDPDVVLIQEFNVGDNSPEDLQGFVDSTFGPGFSYYREPSGNIANGVISRYPILEAGEWEDPNVSDRDFVYARIDAPGERDLWAVSVHFLTRSSSARQAQARDVLRRIDAVVPEDDLLVFGGDLNTGSRGEATFDILSAVVVTSGPYPADHQGNENTNQNRNDPYDHVLADADLHTLAVPTVIGDSEFSAGAVIDTRVYGPLHEIHPAQQGDSNAFQMQHMAVVRDFSLPIEGEEEGQPDAGVVDCPDGGHPGEADAGDPGTPDAGDDTPDAGDEPQPTGGLFINEVLANEPGGDTAGEFVEIVNGTGASVELGGFSLADATGVRHDFAGTTLAAGARLVVFGGAAAVPPGIDAQVASSGRLSLANSGDSITLLDAQGNAVSSVTYGGELADDDGVSMNRSPDADGNAGFVLHSALSADASSPGTAP